MLTLRELKNMVRVADFNQRVPYPKTLRESGGRIVAKEVFEESTEVMVYENGYVLYREGFRMTVFPLHKCEDYRYEKVTGNIEILHSEYFEDEKWYVRLLLEGADLLERNCIRLEQYHHVFSYSAVSEEWELLKDKAPAVLERMVEAETVREILDILDERQKYALISYYCEKRSQAEIAEVLGVTQQGASRLIQNAVKKVRKQFGVESAVVIRISNKKENF